MPAHRLLAHSPDAETRSGVTLRSVQFEVACDARHASDIAVASPPESLTPGQDISRRPRSFEPGLSSRHQRTGGACDPSTAERVRAPYLETGGPARWQSQSAAHHTEGHNRRPGHAKRRRIDPGSWG